MSADVASLEAAKTALIAAAKTCNELTDATVLWKLGRRISEANRDFNRARDAYIEAMWHEFPGVTVDLPSKPHVVAVVIEERPL